MKDLSEDHNGNVPWKSDDVEIDRAGRQNLSRL